MKIIRLTDPQRREITERRRQARGRRIYQRPSAVLWSEAGRTREEIAELSGVSTRRVGDWLRIFRNKGLDELCTRHYRGDPGRLRPARVGRLRQEIAKGGFHNADQVRDWIEEQFGIAYSPSGVKDLLRRIGAGYHKVSGFFLEGGPGEAAPVRPQVSAASARGRSEDPPRLRGCLPPGPGPGAALLLLAAGRAAALRGRRQRPQAAEHPGGVLPDDVPNSVES